MNIYKSAWFEETDLERASVILVSRHNARLQINAAIKAWLKENADRVILSKGVWFIKLEVKVSDITPLFQELFDLEDKGG